MLKYDMIMESSANMIYSLIIIRYIWVIMTTYF